MTRRVAFLHTSPVHVATFERLMAAADPSIEVAHVVAEELLADAQRVGADDPELVGRVHRAMTDAAADAALVVCTCSTIGGAAERTPTDGQFAAARIDRAMADRAVLAGPGILIVAALASTLEPTVRLVRESAAALGREIAIEPHFVDGAWPHFERGERAAYVATIAAAVRTRARGFDVVVLAQASMAPAADALADLGIPVLSSPGIGVESIVARLRD